MNSALRTRLAFVARQSTRAYATPASSDFSITSLSNGIRIATSDDASPTAAVSVIIKAGSRFENSPGLAHVLKNSVFKVRSGPPRLTEANALFREPTSGRQFDSFGKRKCMVEFYLLLLRGRTSS